MVPFNSGRKNIGQQKIGNSFQLISSREMTGDLHAQFAQMLHRAPHLGARGASSSAAIDLERGSRLA